MRYLTGEEILVIHYEIIEKTGGLHGVRDAGFLQSIVERPKVTFDGKERYKDIFSKAAAYFESVAKYHVFVDGNKRTAIAASARFLFLNNFELTASNKPFAPKARSFPLRGKGLFLAALPTPPKQPLRLRRPGISRLLTSAFERSESAAKAESSVLLASLKRGRSGRRQTGESIRRLKIKESKNLLYA